MLPELRALLLRLRAESASQRFPQAALALLATSIGPGLPGASGCTPVTRRLMPSTQGALQDSAVKGSCFFLLLEANAIVQADLEREAVRSRPPSTGRRRRSSDELTAAEVSDRQNVATQGLPDEPLPLGLAALGGLRPNRAAMTFGQRCESPDFGVKADPTDWSFTAPRHGMHGNLGRLKPKGNYGAQDLPLPKQQAGRRA